MNEERFVICIGEGKFAVIAGCQLNDEPLSRAEGVRLAHEPVKPAAKLPASDARAAPQPPKRKPAARSAPQPAPGVALPALPFGGADDDRARRS